MHREKRHAQILDILLQEKLATIADLSQRLDTSYMTIWRDLETLEKQGLVQRVRGGATLPPPSAAGAPAGVQPVLRPIDEVKRKIGRYAAQHLVEDGDYLTIEAGTTASSMVSFLTQANLTVLTNGLFTTGMAFAALHNITLICSGGILIEAGAFTGPQAEEFFAKFRVKKAFLGAQGVTLEDGFTDPSPLYLNLKAAMKRMAETTILMLDSSKFGVRSLMQALPLEEVDILVTDSAAPAGLVAALRQRGLDVRIAD